MSEKSNDEWDEIRKEDYSVARQSINMYQVQSPLPRSITPHKVKFYYFLLVNKHPKKENNGVKNSNKGK